MLVAMLSADAESSGSAKPKESDTSIAHLVDAARDYYTSEAGMRPPSEPSLRVADLPIVLFQNLTSSTALKGFKSHLHHRQLLRLLQAVVGKLKGTDLHRPLDWERESFLLWVVTILKVSLGRPQAEEPALTVWKIMLQTDDKQSLLQVTDIAAELESHRMLRPSLQLAKTSIPKDIQITVSRINPSVY